MGIRSYNKIVEQPDEKGCANISENWGGEAHISINRGTLKADKHRWTIYISNPLEKIEKRQTV